MANHRWAVATIMTTATGSTTADVVLLLTTVVDDHRRRNHRFATHRSQFVAVKLGIQGSIVKLGFVGFLHQELWRVHAVIHHRGSSVDDVRSAVAQFFVFDIRSQGTVLIYSGSNVLIWKF